jgi:hypothetical protein
MKAIDEVKWLIDGLASGDINPDEPLFTLRGRDPNAGAAVVAWGVASHAIGVPDKKVNDARALAAEMTHWPIKQTPGRPETYKDKRP